MPQSDRSPYCLWDITHSLHSCTFVRANRSLETPLASGNPLPFPPKLHLRSISSRKPYTANSPCRTTPGPPPIPLNWITYLLHSFIHSHWRVNPPQDILKIHATKYMIRTKDKQDPRTKIIQGKISYRSNAIGL